MKLLRKITFPFMPLYYLVTWLRNWLYDTGIFKSKSYTLPIICIGNLSVGGTGKTPMVEYVIKALKYDFKLATLSRGYKRKTEGFIVADNNSDVMTIGDEPLQFFKKFKDITVAVDADRRNGIAELVKLGIDTIVLDDAFQHRKVKAGLNILLTTYSNPYFSDYVLPTGNLREPRSGSKRADIIVVTKCPDMLSDSDKKAYFNKIKPKKDQNLFFSSIKYSNSIFSLDYEMPLHQLKGSTFTLVTGIANPKPLVNYLENEGLDFEHISFKDHHEFSPSEINLLKSKSFILTTEKDYMRLQGRLSNTLFFLPIEIIIDRQEVFTKKSS